MKQLYPRARVFAYEPMLENYHQLRANLDRSGFGDVVTIPKGVGGFRRTEKLYVHAKNIGGHSICASGAGGGKSVEIELIDVQDVLDALDGAACNLLKLDCEGAEFEIITSLVPKIAAKIEKIILEPTPSQYDVADVVRHLESLGYRVSWQDGLYLAAR